MPRSSGPPCSSCAPTGRSMPRPEHCGPASSPFSHPGCCPPLAKVSYIPPWPSVPLMSQGYQFSLYECPTGSSLIIGRRRERRHAGPLGFNAMLKSLSYMDLYFILHPSQKTRAVFYKSREGSEHYTAHRFRLHAYAYMYFFRL